jgi:hypothetical protein
VGSTQYRNDQLTESFFKPNSSRTRSRRSFSTGLFTVPILSLLFHAL